VRQPPATGNFNAHGDGAGTLVLRMTNEPNTWTPASSHDTRDALVGLVFHMNGKYYLPGSLVPNMTGLQAGRVYYLTADGNISRSSPASGQTLIVGKAVDATTLLFYPTFQ
jgi:hypothetical protein